MEQLITLATFDNSFEVKYNLLKSMLEEAGISYFVTNENLRIVEPMMFMTPSNLSIEVKIYESDLENGKKICNSIR